MATRLGRWQLPWLAQLLGIFVLGLVASYLAAAINFYFAWALYWPFLWLAYIVGRRRLRDKGRPARAILAPCALLAVAHFMPMDLLSTPLMYLGAGWLLVELFRSEGLNARDQNLTALESKPPLAYTEANGAPTFSAPPLAENAVAYRELDPEGLHKARLAICCDLADWETAEGLKKRIESVVFRTAARGRERFGRASIVAGSSEAAADPGALMHVQMARADACVILYSAASSASPWLHLCESRFRALHPRRELILAFQSDGGPLRFPAFVKRETVEPLVIDLQRDKHAVSRIAAAAAEVGVDAVVGRVRRQSIVQAVLRTLLLAAVGLVGISGVIAVGVFAINYIFATDDDAVVRDNNSELAAELCDRMPKELAGPAPDATLEQKYLRTRLNWALRGADDACSPERIARP